MASGERLKLIETHRLEENKPSFKFFEGKMHRKKLRTRLTYGLLLDE